MKKAVVLLSAVAIIIAIACPIFVGAYEAPYPTGAFVRQFERELRKAKFTPDQLCVHAIGQSHIDAAWKWRLKQTHTKVYRTWSMALEHMEKNPDFTFSGSAPQYYEWVLHQHPDLFAKILEREKEGRWEIVGGQWVEPDGNMPDGESFIRQRLVGQRFYLEHFGHISEVGWMLDSFGYHRNMPQIMQKSGAKYMWTSKLTWNDTTVFPFHNFHWRSPDGSQVLTHICPIVPLPMFFPVQELNKYKDTRYLLKPDTELVADYTTLPETITAAMSDDWLPEIGAFYGVGDGGLGPRWIEVQIQDALKDKGYVKFSHGLTLFQHIEECADRLPVWDDEMYLEFHRGVQTTQAWIKRANRKAEQMIQTTENLRSIAHVFGITYPYESLKEIWKSILLQHFHDILPGSSIPEVYEDAKEDYKFIKSATRDIKYAGLEALAKIIDTKAPSDGMEPVVVFNPIAFERSSLVRVEIPTGASYAVYDQNGSPVTSQEFEKRDKNYVVFRAEDMPSMGYRVYFMEQVDEAPEGDASGISVHDSNTATAIILENEFVKVAINKQDGLIHSLIDKDTDKELLSGPSNKIVSYYDRPEVYSAWNINKNYLKNPLPSAKLKYIKVTSEGPLWVEAKIKSEVEHLGKITKFKQRVRLVQGDPVVYLDLYSDYHLTDSLTKIEFQTVLHSNTIATDGPYLVLEKPTHPRTKAEKAQWEIVCQKWLDLAEPEMGLALLNNGKYGFSLINEGTGFALSVIKGARYPRANPGAKDVKHRYQSWPIPTGFTDQGRQKASMGLLIHQGDWREARLWEAGYNFNAPLEAVWAEPHSGKLPPEASFISVDSDSVYLGNVKRAEDDGDLVLRLVEAVGQPGSATVRFGEGMQVMSASETDMLELNPSSMSAGGSSLSVDLSPYEIKTIKVNVTR